MDADKWSRQSRLGPENADGLLQFLVRDPEPRLGDQEESFQAQSIPHTVN